MRRLICVFAGCTSNLVGNAVSRLICLHQTTEQVIRNVGRFLMPNTNYADWADEQSDQGSLRSLIHFPTFSDSIRTQRWPWFIYVGE